jgi:hypothetical protein
MWSPSSSAPPLLDPAGDLLAELGIGCGEVGDTALDDPITDQPRGHGPKPGRDVVHQPGLSLGRLEPVEVAALGEVARLALVPVEPTLSPSGSDNGSNNGSDKRADATIPRGNPGGSSQDALMLTAQLGAGTTTCV